MGKDLDSKRNMDILNDFCDKYHFEGDTVVIPDAKRINPSFYYGQLHKLKGIKEIRIDSPGDIYSSGDMLLRRDKDGRETLLFCFGNEKKVVVPDGVNVIWPAAFLSTAITSVLLPDSVEEISDRAFLHCRFLSEITLPDHLKTIGGYAFSNCWSLKSITVPESVQELPDGVFVHCSSLKEVKLPRKLETISDYAFAYCVSLKSVDLPAAVRKIGENAFVNCESLTHINLPEGLFSIGQFAFYGCGLKEITLPSSLLDIHKRCFTGIQQIHTQHYNANLVMAAAGFPGPDNISSGADSFCIDLQGEKFVFPRTMSQRGIKDANSYLETNAKKNSGSVHSVHNVGFTDRARHQAALSAYKMSPDAIIAYNFLLYGNLKQYLERYGADMVEEAAEEEELVSLLRDFQEIGISREMVEKALEISEEKGWACSAALALEVSRKNQQESFSL